MPSFVPQVKAPPGRPSKKATERVANNGLYLYQWKRICKDAAKANTTGAWLLREIVRQYYERKDNPVDSQSEAVVIPVQIGQQ